MLSIFIGDMAESMNIEPTCQIRALAPLSKWFYDTSTEVATGAARCGSFAEKAFSLFGCSLWMNMVDTMIYMVRTA
jgi:hypothetical protein